MKNTDTETFIKNAIAVHENKYNYDKVNYVNWFTKVTIECSLHGKFVQRPSSHTRGQGCPKCAYQQKSVSYRLSQKEFVRRAKLIHKNEYDYEQVEYKTNKVKVKIICSLHGLFEVSPGNHLKGKKCRECDRIRRTKIINPDREQVRLRASIGSRAYSLLARVLKIVNKNKTDRTHKLLGYSRKQLCGYLTSHPKWPLVKGKCWHIDHIFPVKAFVEHGITDLKIINALDNLQPIVRKDNLRKGSKYDEEKFINYIVMKYGTDLIEVQKKKG